MLKAGIPEIEIYSRQGHDSITSLRHYQSLSFTDHEMRDIGERLTEWGILRRGIQVNVSIKKARIFLKFYLILFTQRKVSVSAN
jgi:hypothetical protein